MNCDECGTELLTYHEAKDRGRWIWCRNCGLVCDTHSMGRGISGLMAWMRIYGITKSQMRKVTTIYINTNLYAARMNAIKIIGEMDEND